MATRRVLWGNNGSTLGLRTTLFNYDARNDDADDPTKFSFNSDWTDIVRIHKYGLIDPPISSPAQTGPIPGSFTTAPYDDANNPWLISVAHTLGYVPFCEGREMSGYAIFDDRRMTQGTLGDSCGGKCWGFSDQIKVNTFSTGTPSSGYSGARVGYIIYEIQVLT